MTKALRCVLPPPQLLYHTQIMVASGAILISSQETHLIDFRGYAAGQYRCFVLPDTSDPAVSQLVKEARNSRRQWTLSNGFAAQRVKYLAELLDHDETTFEQFRLGHSEWRPGKATKSPVHSKENYRSGGDMLGQTIRQGVLANFVSLHHGDCFFMRKPSFLAVCGQCSSPFHLSQVICSS